jgi:hypothetical protein
VHLWSCQNLQSSKTVDPTGVFVFRLHVPAAIRTNIAARLHLDGAEPGFFNVSYDNIRVRDTLRGESGDISASKQFRHDMMVARRAEQGRLRGHG